MFSSWPLYAEISAWYIKLNTMKLKFANFYFCGCSTVVIDCCTPEKKWKQVIIRFFTEYGTVVRLEERTEHCMPALWATQATKTIFHCKLTVAFQLEAGLFRSQLILILVRCTQLDILYFPYKRDPIVVIIANLFHR